jgi:threonine dehydratase
MFHYRNHGSAWARVLVGVQAADDEMMSLRRELRDIGYRFWEETDNPAYRLLLS